MARRQQWSGRDLVLVANGTRPLTGLSDADDAVIVERMQPHYEDPHIDLTGENGVHVKNNSRHIRITVKFKIGATTSLAYMQSIIDSGQPMSVLTGRNLGSDTSAFYANDVAIADEGQWGGGKNPVEPTFIMTAIEGKATHGGQRVLPV